MDDDGPRLVSLHHSPAGSGKRWCGCTSPGGRFKLQRRRLKLDLEGKVLSVWELCFLGALPRHEPTSGSTYIYHPNSILDFTGVGGFCAPWPRDS